ncbi:MAG: electron transfer flavoprotein subunit beta/FixA family protein [Dehalococcoidia bacterium]|nr:electron transfer flavoprotein subunit beta/FixA family protein [Dehalococcoidia bacterium]
MNIVVCVKRVPDTKEADVTIAKDGKGINTENMVHDINEWDRYALEEAVLLKEKFGGSVTVISMGPNDVEDTLIKGLAGGADAAIRITDPAFAGSDSYAVARVLSQVVRKLPFDLVLTGVQADDDGLAQVGPTLAELLKVPHAAVVTQIEITGSVAKVHRELESGLEEVDEVKLPAVFSVQTGMNEPRYVSIMAIRKAAKKETKVLDLKEIGLAENEVGERGSRTRIEKMFVPVSSKQAEILKGSTAEVVEKLSQILKEKGGVA